MPLDIPFWDSNYSARPPLPLPDLPALLAQEAWAASLGQILNNLSCHFTPQRRGLNRQHNNQAIPLVGRSGDLELCSHRPRDIITRTRTVQTLTMRLLV